MAGSAADFRLELRAAADEVDALVMTITQKIAMFALSSVVMRSPVDTGRFRGNWLVSTGSPNEGMSENTDPGGQATIALGASAITGLKQPEILWLQNNLPYAQRLENGWSKQAPAGIVAVTFAEITSGFGGGV